MPKRRVYKRDRIGRFAHDASSSGARPNGKGKRPLTGAQRTERNRKVVRGGLIAAHLGVGYARVRGPAATLALASATGHHHVTAAAGLKIGTTLAVSANEIHNVHRLTSREFTTGVRPHAKGRIANNAARDLHIASYERRQRRLNRADTAAGWILGGAGLLSAGNALAVAYGGGYRRHRRRRGAARTSGLPRTASTGPRRFGNRATARGGVYNITGASSPRGSRARRSRVARHAASLSGLRIKGVIPKPRRRF